MPNELENTNSQNGEQDNQVQEEEQPQESSTENSGEESQEESQSNELTEREKQFLARAKKAESKLKEQKEETKETNEQPEYLSRDEAVLIAKGVDEDRLAVLKKLQAADGKQKPLTAYQEDDVYKAFDNQLKAEEQKQKAQVTSNRGGGSPADQIQPGASREEHKKIWEKYQS